MLVVRLLVRRVVDVLDARIGQIAHPRIGDALLVQQVLTPQQHLDKRVELGRRLDMLVLEYGRVELAGEPLPLHGLQEVAEGRFVRLVERQQRHGPLQLVLYELVVLAILAQVLLRERERLLQTFLANQLNKLLLL